MRRLSWIATALLGVAPVGFLSAAEAVATATNKPVSFYREIRPIFQANCQGCHQPAKAKGGYVMTEFEKLLEPGDSKEKPIVATHPETSHLVKQITPEKGEAEMPKGKAPLPDFEIEKIRRWIAEGAHDDTPANARQRYDAEHPPVYTRPPVIPSIDYSPDGRLIAVAGFHEVLLHKADGSGLAGRLVGLSDRVQTVRFSPDGKQLAVAGGQPARLGEIQIWDVEKRKLTVSVPIGYDTAYGVNWSPDGKLVAFGCPDKTVRAIEAATGKQVLQQGSHNDWVLDTVFSTNGAHVISVGRDMSAKLTEVATQRFIDNITSITPGALRGGLQSVARHPSKDEILVGGADGVPQIYRVFRQTARKIGDNANLIRRFPAMEGRIFSVDYSRDGRQIAAAASLDAHGAINVYSAAFDSAFPQGLPAILEKEVEGQSAEEKAAVEKYVTADVKLLRTVAFSNAAVYAVRFSPDGTRIAAAGSDGKVRLIDAATGTVAGSFDAAPSLQSSSSPAVAATDPAAAAGPAAPGGARPAEASRESLPKGTEVAKLVVQPADVKLSSRTEHVQLVVTARLTSGDEADVTRLATFAVSDGLGTVSPSGRFTALKAGKGSIVVSLNSQEARVPLDLGMFRPSFDSDFVQDVNPVLSKLGCNAGTCHGAKEGKNGFKLSLRGYDPVYDVRAFTDDQASRRVAVASPDDSLMLLKATGAVPHEGGQRTTTESEYYAILRQWIAAGAPLNIASPRVARIEVFPKDPVVQEIGARQQMRIVATFADGRSRDVTSEAFVESGNTDVASTDPTGLVTSLRRGEAPILARYEGAYAATTLTVMGDRSGFVWKEPPSNNRIDELVAAKWQRMKILPSELAGDAEFLRRVYLDLTGLPPAPEDVRRFLADKGDTRSKRDELIDRLLGSPEFVDHWTSKWADLLQVNRKFLGEEGATAFRDWIRAQVAANTPYDEFVRQILTAKGSNRENPAAAYYKILRTPAETMENTTHLFLATRFNCNKCHDHPFERWTQDQYYHMAAFFAQVDLQPDPAGGDRRIGGSAVEGSKPLFEKVLDKTEGEVKHDRTGKISAPEFPFPAHLAGTNAPATRRERLAAWITSGDNRYFALSYVNRLWGYLMGVGLIDPLDDIRAGNPPSNPALLDYLTREFVDSGFNTRRILRLVCQSRTYQLSVATQTWNADDRINYSHATARRLPAEVLMDAVYKVTGSTLNIPGVKLGTRAAQLIDSASDVPSGFLANLGRPPRESACECERSNDLRLGSIMSLLSGPAVSGAVNDPKNDLARLVAREKDDSAMVREVFMRILNRPATDKEVDSSLKIMSHLEQEHARLTNDLAKAEASWAAELAGREKQRQEAIHKAEAALSAHLVSQAPKIALADREREERIADASRAVDEFQPLLPMQLNDWESRLTREHFDTRWVMLDPREVKGSGSVRLEKLGDGSVRSAGANGELPDYTITADSPLAGITGIKLEVLPDDALPGFGPGYHEGNFLLSELVVESGSKTNAAKLARQKIVDGKADFVQKDHDLKHVFDGKVEQGRREGWAVGGGGVAQPHWASFAFEKPLGTAEGTTLRIILQHRFQAPYDIGRFRLWVTTSPNPAAEGLPADIADIASISALLRTPPQAARMMEYYRTQDPELRKRNQALVAARKPLPDDEKVKELRAALAAASKPIPTDPALVQLRQDVEASRRQMANRRLTAAQDIAWALINTPAFLFNR
jgi:WD40 repeat protein